MCSFSHHHTLTAMLAPNSALGANDGDDEIPLQSLRTIIAAEKIVNEKRKEQEALAVEPSLGFNEEWCKANQDKTASSFKIRDLYGHMMPVQHGQPPIPVLTQFLSVVSNNNVYSMVKAAKGAKKEAKDADTWAKALTEINATILKNVCVLRGKKSKEFYVAKPITTSQNGYKLNTLTCLVGLQDCGLFTLLATLLAPYYLGYQTGYDGK